MIQATIRVNFTDTVLGRKKPDTKEYTLLDGIH